MPPDKHIKASFANPGSHTHPVQKSPDTSETPAYDADTIKAAQEFNNAGHGGQVGRFPLDWIRKLQMALGVPEAQWSTDRTFEEETIKKIMDFQLLHPELLNRHKKADGQLGTKTRIALESAYPQLNQALIGAFTEPGRILVPKDAVEGERYDYYAQVIGEAGGYLDPRSGHINMLGIRGVVFDQDGNIKQTATADAYQKAQDNAGKPADQQSSDKNLQPKNQSHFSDGGGARTNKKTVNDAADIGAQDTWDDIIVSLWIDDQDVKHVKERKGSVDPGTSGDTLGAAHLRDGQYTYGLGKHGTKSSAHQKVAKKVVEENSNITGGQGESSYRYTALRSQGNVEVLRDDTKNLGKVPGYFKQKDLDRSIEAIRKDDDRYTGTGHTAINIHLGGEDLLSRGSMDQYHS